MDDLKTLYDRVLSAQAAIASVKNEIYEALALGTEEGDEQALALEGTLDRSVAEAEKWLAFYNKVGKPQKEADLTKFIPVSETPTEPDGNAKGIMNRADWNKLDQLGRADFIKGGGKLEDQGV